MIHCLPVVFPLLGRPPRGIIGRMARTVTDIDVLQEYISGVMANAEHHAGEVEEIALAVAGAIIWRKDGPIQVWERNGSMTNALWATINGRRYFFSYNHDEKTIDVHGDGKGGPWLASFDNRTPITEVKEFFHHL